MFVIDLDTHKNRAAWQWWQGLLAVHNNGHRTRDMVSQRTGGGGRQLAVFCSARLARSDKPNQHRRRFQGLLPALPSCLASLHDSGKHYKWEPGCAPWDDRDSRRLPNGCWRLIEDLVETHGGDTVAVAGGERTASSGGDFDAFGKRTDGREEYMRNLIWAAVVGWYRECPIGPPSPAESAARMGETWLVYERHARSRLPPEEGISNAELLEREGRGHSLFANKWRRAMKKWHDQVAEDAAKPKPGAGEGTQGPQGAGQGTSGAPNGGAATIRCGADLTTVAEAAERAVVEADLPIYRRDTMLVRPIVLNEHDAYGHMTRTVGLSPLNVIMMRSYLEQAARFERYDGRAKSWVHCKPPNDIAELILARAGHWPFAALKGVLAAPSLRPDGSLIDRPGYDEATRMYVIEPPPMPAIPERPSWSDGVQAMELLNRLLGGFPWQGDDDARAVGLSALMTPVLRAALPTAPLHAISAPEAGSGKSFLTQLAAAIATGASCPVIAAGKNEEETEKRLASVLLSGLSMVSIDNVSRPLGGDFLCQLLDQQRVKIRILGQTAGPEVEPRCTMFATGNNLTLFGDVVRRAVIARMDAACTEPWRRQFHVDPLAQVMADRGRYIAAVLVVVRAFLVSGEPMQPPLASFGAWSNMVRSAIVAFGYGDPARTMASAVADDPDRQTLGAVLTAWWKEIGADWTSTADLVRRGGERDATGGYKSKDLRDALMMVAAGRSGDVSPSRLGAWLRSHRDRELTGLVLRRAWDERANVARWAVAER